MFKKFLPLIICATISIPSIAHAVGNNLTFSKLESGITTVANPFKSQLPKIEEPKIETPIIVKDTDGPIRRPELPKPIEVLPEPEERPVPHVTISGVIWNSDRPQAIINGIIVDIGDTVSEIQITGIQKTAIDGLFDGRNVTLQP
ncbi:MAG: hypothetical protein KAS66_10000 [Candidatus Omnitrophica bacterium]|nr:hypothetical protein [Candidatus Omnitrophota bacterium]